MCVVLGGLSMHSKVADKLLGSIITRCHYSLSSASVTEATCSELQNVKLTC